MAGDLPPYKLKQAIEYINAHLGENISLLEIAAQVDMSQYYFCRLFKESVGMTPHQYVILQRIERSKYLLLHTKKTILSIADECGFADSSHFAKHFNRRVGVSPGKLRRK